MPGDEHKLPMGNVALPKTNGEWIIYYYTNGSIEARLFGDDRGRKLSIKLYPARQFILRDVVSS